MSSLWGDPALVTLSKWPSSVQEVTLPKRPYVRRLVFSICSVSARISITLNRVEQKEGPPSRCSLRPLCWLSCIDLLSFFGRNKTLSQFGEYWLVLTATEPAAGRESVKSMARLLYTLFVCLSLSLRHWPPWASLPLSRAGLTPCVLSTRETIRKVDP